MSWIVADGFDYYATIADVARSVWDAADTTGGTTFNLSTPGRFPGGQCLRCGVVKTVLLTKNIPTNESTLFLCCAYYKQDTLAGTNAELYIQLRDGATNQCTIVFESSGNLVLKSGTFSGTVLATFTGAFPSVTWTHFQIKVVINNTTGEFRVRKNGSPTDSFVATGLNTRGGTANNYANVVNFGLGAAPTQFDYLDDVLIFSGSGAAPNDFVGDVRALVLPAAAATAQQQFTASATTGTCGPPVAGASSRTVAANTVEWVGPVLGRAGTLTKLTVNMNTALAGNIRAAVYATGTDGKPSTLLATTATVTNPALGLNDLAVTGGPVLSSVRQYFLAMQVDANASLKGDVAATWPQFLVYTQSRTFASGLPDPAVPVLASSAVVSAVSATVTSSVVAVTEPVGNGDTDYLYDSVVGDSDLYAMEDLPLTPAAVIGVVSKIYAKKSDAGTRNGQVLVNSAGTQVAGTDTPLPSTYTYLARVDAVDPATGAAWTPAAVNALQVGQKVTA